jgi:hypothetical protein
VGRELRLPDYIEGVGQPLAYYAHELRRRGWNDVIVYLQTCAIHRRAAYSLRNNSGSFAILSAIRLAQLL